MLAFTAMYIKQLYLEIGYIVYLIINFYFSDIFSEQGHVPISAQRVALPRELTNGLCNRNFSIREE